MSNLVKTDGKNKIDALEKYLKERFELRQCELTGHVYTKERSDAKSDWEQHEHIQTLWHQVRKHVTYETYRGLSSKYGKDFVTDLLVSKDVSPPYHPLKAYLEALKVPDNPNDVFDEFCNYIVLENDIVEERKFLKNAIKKWSVGSIRAVYDNEYVPKQILLFRSIEESIGKTSFLQSLIPEGLVRFAYDIDNIEVANKDPRIALTNKFIGYLDEIDLFFKSKANVNAFKSFVTKKYVNVRHPYGRVDVFRWRIMSFLGTCNGFEFLSESVGKSRFIVINVKALVNKKYIKKNNLIGEKAAEDFDVSKFWASAYMLYKQGFDCYFTNDEEQDIFDRNAAHQFADPLAELLLLNYEPSSKEDGVFMSSTEIQRDLQNVDKDIFISTIKMGKTLISKGFKKIQTRVDGRRKWGYWVKRIAQENENSEGWIDPKKKTKTIKLL